LDDYEKTGTYMLNFKRLYRNNSLEVTYNGPGKILQVRWLHQPESQAYREDLLHVTRLALEKGVGRILFDVRLRTFLDISDQNWVLREVMPLFGNRHVHFAYVVNIQNIELMDTYRLQKQVSLTPALQKKFTIELFLDLEEALQWLLGKGTSLSAYHL